MTEQAGYLNEPDLVEECTKRAHYILFHHAAYADEGQAIVLAVLSVLRKRGLLTIQALELLADK